MLSYVQINAISQITINLPACASLIIIISTLLSTFNYLFNQTKKSPKIPKNPLSPIFPLIAQAYCSLQCCLAQILVYNHGRCYFCSLSPKVFLYFWMASLTIWQAFSLPSNWSTCTSLFSIFLQSSKKRRTWSSRWRGNCSISLQCDTDLSLLATEMILSSSSPWSIMRITPITFASTRHSVSTLAEQSTKISRGSLSSQQV